MYAIVNVKTGKFVYGTDYCFGKPKQRTSKNRMFTRDDLFGIQSEYLTRKCGENYKIALLKPVEIERLIEPPKNWDEAHWAFDERDEE